MCVCGVCVCVCLPKPSARAGWDTKSIFKWSLTGLNSEFSFLFFFSSLFFFFFWLVAIPSLKSLVWPTVFPWLITITHHGLLHMCASILLKMTEKVLELSCSLAFFCYRVRCHKSGWRLFNNYPKSLMLRLKYMYFQPSEIIDEVL